MCELNGNGAGFYVVTEIQSINSVSMVFSSNTSTLTGSLTFAEEKGSFEGEKQTIIVPTKDTLEEYKCSDSSRYHYISCWIGGGTGGDGTVFRLKSITINYSCE